LSALSTPGGHRRYKAGEIQAVIDRTPGDQAEGEADTSTYQEDVVHLYDQGRSIRQIAGKIGRDYGFTRRLLLNQCVKLRAPCGRHPPQGLSRSAACVRDDGVS